MKSSAVEGVKVEISVVLGKAKLPMQQLLRMGRGAVIELEAKQNEQVWILANNKLIARGEIMLQGEKIGVSITDMTKSLSTSSSAAIGTAVAEVVSAAQVPPPPAPEASAAEVAPKAPAVEATPEAPAPDGAPQ